MNRFTVSALLKSVISVMAACVVIVLASSAWGSLERLRAAGRISTIAEALTHTFQAMHNLRSDRATTFRTLNGEATIAPETQNYLRGVRDIEMPAMRDASELIASIDFTDQKTLHPALVQAIDKLTGLQTESWEAMSKPKASRRPTLAKEFMESTQTVLNALERIGTRLAAAVNHDDPMIDQLLAIKQAAWLLRSTAGEIATIITSGLATGRITPEAKLAYIRYAGGTEAAWNGLELSMSGMQLPASIVSAMATAKTAYFDPQYLALSDRLVNALANGEKPEMTANEWSPFTVGRMGTAVAVAERALDEAKSYMLSQQAAARNALILQLVLLSGALAVAVGSMLAVTRRVIKPLHIIRDAMLKVAGGDLSVDVGHADRKDEIGALVGALGTFKQQAEEKNRIERQEHERNARAASRQQAIELSIAEFESQVRDTLHHLANASGDMKTTSDGMSAVSSQTNARAQVAAKASGEASMSVQSVASASEELSVSINDISRQAAHAAGIAGRAVKQAQDTDGTVQGLAKTASRIGEVVGLINDIASQTNLLALNATIEAARAGDAGRGFAVVASEVKSLASQTAKATEDISGQIADIQKVANEAIDAIKAIGGIIGEVNEVATAIAAAVEQQGAATQEITRSTQQAAQGTQNVADNIVGVSADADAAGAAAQNVKRASETLGAQTRQLDGQVAAFLGKIRAA